MASIHIKYVGISPQRESELDLNLLGESIQGFDQVLRELIDVMKVRGEVEIRATKVSQGSIVIEILIDISTDQFFSHIRDYLAFLELVDLDAYRQVMTDLGELNAARRAANDWVAENPIDAGLIVWGLRKGIVKLLRFVRLQKQSVRTEDEGGDRIPTVYAPRLKRLIRERSFRKAVKPFVEGAASTIVVGADSRFRDAAEITASNFGDYLSEDQRILPDWENGNVIRVTGRIVSLQCTRGETMKIQIHGIPRRYRLLVAEPPLGRTTQDYLDFYRRDVVITARIVRRSLYQKPTLLIQAVELAQMGISD